MGQSQINLTQLGSIFCCLGWVSDLWFGSGFGKFPLKIPNFQFFPLGQKKSLRVESKSTEVKEVYCGSKVWSRWVGPGPISSEFL